MVLIPGGIEMNEGNSFLNNFEIRTDKLVSRSLAFIFCLFLTLTIEAIMLFLIPIWELGELTSNSIVSTLASFEVIVGIFLVFAILFSFEKAFIRKKKEELK